MPSSAAGHSPTYPKLLKCPRGGCAIVSHCVCVCVCVGVCVCVRPRAGWPRWGGASLARPPSGSRGTARPAWSPWGKNKGKLCKKCWFFIVVYTLQTITRRTSTAACKKSKRLFNPFLPTGQFLAPKWIILIKCWIDILKCWFNVCSCWTRCEFGLAIMFRSW